MAALAVQKVATLAPREVVLVLEHPKGAALVPPGTADPVRAVQEVTVEVQVRVPTPADRVVVAKAAAAAAEAAANPLPGRISPSPL